MAEKIICNPEVFSSRAFPGEDKTKRCFVIMPFKSETDEEKRIQDVYKHHILPVAKKCGLDCTRADDRRYFRNGKPIMEQIWKAICTADIIIGDFTTSNPNVTYEAGLAHTIGKPLIGIVQNMSDVPFDYRHLRFITYTTTHKGYEKLDGELEEEIRAYMKELEEEYPQRHSEKPPADTETAQKLRQAMQERDALREELVQARQIIVSVEDEMGATESNCRAMISQLDQAYSATESQLQKQTEVTRKQAAKIAKLEQELAALKATLKPRLIEPLPKAGDTYTFGPFEWLVLDVQEDKALLITEDIVNVQVYDESQMNATWGNCSLRQFLNGELYDGFGAAKGRIIKTNNINSETSYVTVKGKSVNTSGGNPTEDYLFLLSIEEVTKWLARKKCNNDRNPNWPEEVTVTEGLNINWWLRSPGATSWRAAFVRDDGRVDIAGEKTAVCLFGVRPALWLSFAE